MNKVKQVKFRVKVEYKKEFYSPLSCEIGFVKVSDVSDYFDDYIAAQSFIENFENTERERKDFEFSIYKYWVC